MMNLGYVFEYKKNNFCSMQNPGTSLLWLSIYKDLPMMIYMATVIFPSLIGLYNY